MVENDNYVNPGESCIRELQIGEETIFRNNRPVRFRVEMTMGTLIEGVVPANSDFKITPQHGDIVKFDIFVDDLPESPQLVD